MVTFPSGFSGLLFPAVRLRGIRRARIREALIEIFHFWASKEPPDV